MRTGLIAAIVLVMSVPAAADVVDRSASGFTLNSVVRVAAPSETVYRHLINLGAWWGKDHTYTGDSANMSLEARAGGCWCEKLPNGGGVEHGRVTNLAPGTLVRLSAALGPLQELGVTGSLTWQLAKSGQETTVTMTYAVGGYVPGGLEKLAPLVDQVMTQQLHLLHAYAEKNR